MKKMFCMKKMFVISALCICAALAGCAVTGAEVPKYSSAEYTKESGDDPIMSMRVTDIDGNELSMGTIISQNDVTMINIWGTFCGPCLNEMPDLEAVSRLYKRKGFGIVGVTCDTMTGSGGVDKARMKEAVRLRRSMGISYPLVTYTPELYNWLPTDTVPTTVFVDKHGKRLDEPIIGSMGRADWEREIDRILAK